MKIARTSVIGSFVSVCLLSVALFTGGCFIMSINSALVHSRAYGLASQQ